MNEKVAQPSAQAQDATLAEGLWERSARTDRDFPRKPPPAGER